MFFVLETFKNVYKLEDIAFATKMFLNMLGANLTSSKFCFATMFPEVGKQGNINRKHVSVTMFPSFPW